jgi:hypothetical protein
VDINLSEVHLLDSAGFLASPLDLIDHPSYSLPLQANRTRSLIASTGNMKAAYLSDSFILQDLTVPLHKTSNTRYLTILYILIYIHQDATFHILFYLETALHVLGWYHYPSAGAHTTVSTASGICRTVTATCRYCSR